MTYLLSIAVGPVQPFIEAARRTADLTAGSDLLVEIAKAVAGSVKPGGGELIFPAPDKYDKVTDGPNKILAKVPGDPAAIAEKARKAAQKVLDDAWKIALAQAGSGNIDTAIADAQIKTFLEFYAAWVPLGADYKTARQQVEYLLAGRKDLRDFKQPAPVSGVFKSPLDPARDSVLVGARPKPKPSDPDPPYVRTPPMYLKPAEHLDAVSLIKRVLGCGKGGVPSTTELSSVALVADIKKDAARSPHLTTLEDMARKAGSGIGLSDLLYPGRREDAVKSGELSRADADTAAKVAAKALGSPAPPDWASYYAILCADGDHMGKLLGEMNTPEAHVEFSKKLSGFAGKAKQTVKDHDGHCVYSGGDDVVALLPTHTALSCAAKLAEEFHSAIGGTLSVGVAVVHHMDPLRISLERAREAEREAKKERNSLAVALHTRGGEPRTVAEVWSDDYNLKTWNDWIAAFRDKDGLSHGFPYELRHLAREARELFAGDPSKPAVVLEADTLKAEALRILERKKGGKEEPGKGHAFDLPALKNAIESADSPDKLEKLVAKLVICRFLAQYPEVK